MTRFFQISGLMVAASAGAGAEPVDFNRDIRPILTKHCTACHGGVKSAGGISFVSKEGAFAEGESGEHAIVAGDPGASEMLRRIRSRDPEEMMPKPKHGPPLSDGEADLIEQWIREGAGWKNHWAFEPPVAEPLPEVADPAWEKSPLDRFVLARIEREKLAPSPNASPAEWLRRVHFDLTGLAPSPGDVEAFELAASTDLAAAKATVVDRLLASPTFGERWTAVWLDLARYSDTYGFEKDPTRDIWPYRDWLIRAFNADMPFDRFTVEQLAGDLLPEATADQRLATAFHRNTQTNTEGGTDDEEFRVAAVIDRVSATWTTWQGTTFGCAQCHDHPYEPITHRDFYSFYALLNNTLDCDQDNDFPKMKVPTDRALANEASELEIAITRLRDGLNDDGRKAAAASEWYPFTPEVLKPSHGKLLVSSGHELRSEGTLPVGTMHEVEGSSGGFSAIRLRILPESDDPARWPERGSWVSEFKLARADAAGKRQPIAVAEVFVDQIDAPMEPHPGGNVGGFPKLERPRWAVFVPTEPVVLNPGERLVVSMRQKAATSGPQATPLRRFALETSNAPVWTALISDESRKKRREELAAVRQRHSAIPGTAVPVMIERSEPRETRMFARGNRLSKEDVVEPGLPAMFGAGPARDRLAMARWLVGPQNPLAARVMVNRLWAELFGEGIVVTQEDFGSSGALPADQSLLDHLALRFRDHHRWSVKAMLRELVLSATYGQTHVASPEKVARDPRNRLFARGPRVRLTAEMIRDQALGVSGLLSPKMHGPPVFPPQPDGVWSSVYSGAKWVESKGEDRYRRGIYTFSKRTSGFPGFLTFDSPSRDVCTARRITSNTPLQALVTLNDPAHIEFARGLASRMAGAAPDLRGRIAYGVRLATQRAAPESMIDELAALHGDAAAEYAADPALSGKISADPAEAALVLVANTILNLDTALNR